MRRLLGSLIVVWGLGCGVGSASGAIDDTSDALSSVSLPGRVQAEAYMGGGEGVGYHDTTPGNAGGAARRGAVDIEPAHDTGGGYDVGWVASGEWLAYDAQVAKPGAYTFTARVASANAGKKSLHVEVDGVNVTGTMSFDGGAGWQSWQSITSKQVSLTAGGHTLKIVFETSLLNLNYVDATFIAPPTTPVPPVDAGSTAPPTPPADAGSPTPPLVDAGSPTPPTTGISCPSTFSHEAFRDDFNGSSIDTSKWEVEDFAPGGSEFTQLTNMRTQNVTVSNGVLHLSSIRHCEDPRANRSAAAHPTQCSGTNYYSGAWVKTKNGYAGGKGFMAFLAKVPAPVRGAWPGIWGRNMESDTYYGEFDLLEMWWDLESKGVEADPNSYSVATWMGSHHTTDNIVGPMPNLTTAFHVWEVEWDATTTPTTAKFYYRDAPGSARILQRTRTYQSQGLSGNTTDDIFKTAVNSPWRAYLDYAVQPDTVWNISPDTASTYAPNDLLVDSVIICQP